MLNEIYSIYKGLHSAGVLPEIRHNEIHEPGRNNTTFRVMLEKDGSVVSVKLMTKEQIQDSWSLGNKQTQFPAIKVKYPLINGAHNEYALWKENTNKPTAGDYRRLISHLAQQYRESLEGIKVWPSYREKILERKKQLEGCQTCSEIIELFERYSKSSSGVDILEQVRNKLIDGAKQESDDKILKATCDLLFGEKLKFNGKEIDDNKRITLLLDCFPRDDIDIYASSRRHVGSLSQALFEAESKEHRAGRAGKCALSNQDGNLVDKIFPEEKLAIVGPTILFAKNEQTSGITVERYGKSRGEAFPLSEGLSKQLAASISFLTSDKFKDKTWSNLPSSSLLIAYCREDWEVAVTPLITGESDIEDFDDYLDAASNVITSFTGRDLSLDATVEFVEIIKVDKANRKVSFSTSARVSQLIQSAEQWKQSCRNTPDFKLYALLRNNEKQMCARWVISPQQVMSISRQKYIRDGSESTKIPGISFADVMKLFLRQNCQTLAKHSLMHIGEQYQPLLRYCSIGRLQWSLGRKAHVKSDPKLNAQALDAVTLMSVLLYKIGRTKENYMTDFAFQLGQLCSAMDELHIGYCKSERKGDIPNTLLGNQTYGMALQNPKKALEFMATRRRPYDSWVKRMMAKNNRSDDKAVTSAIFAQIWMSKHAKLLSELLSKQEDVNSDTYKAELMLGYLAGRPFEQKNESAKINDN